MVLKGLDFRSDADRAAYAEWLTYPGDLAQSVNALLAAGHPSFTRIFNDLTAKRLT
jgi:hypothetical protein